MEVGLVDWTGGFLTGERFGGGVDVSGTALGWKQTWLVEAVPDSAGACPRRWWAWLRGPGARPLVVEACGAVRTLAPSEEAEEEEGTLLLVEAHASGAWSLREAPLVSPAGGGGRFLESDGEDVLCVSRVGSPRGLWLPRLAGPALACLFHPPRARFARADPQLGRVWADAAAGERGEGAGEAGAEAGELGAACGFLLRRRGSGACVHLEAVGQRFLSGQGRLVPGRPSAQTALLLRLRPGGGVALADRTGRPLFPQGPRGLLRPAEDRGAQAEEAPGGEGAQEGGEAEAEEEEEWFQVRRLPTRVALRSPAAQRFLSVLRGGDVYAGSRSASPLGSFLLEAGLDDGDSLRLRGPHSKYLAQRVSGAVRADGEAWDPATLFRALWLCGTLFLRAPDGRFLGTGPGGRVRATATEPGPREEFWLRLADRPFVVLRGARGFVGSRKSQGSPSSSSASSCRDREQRGLRLLPLRADLLEPDVVELLPCARGVYHLRSRGKGFWGVGSEGSLFCGAQAALNFCLELRGPHCLALLAPNGLYVRGDLHGALRADAHHPHHWDF